MRRLLIVLLLAYALPLRAASDDMPLALQLGRPFSHHAVLQRDRPCPIFGIDAVGATVRISFGPQTVTAKAGPDGAWRAELAPMSASRVGRNLTISGSSEVVLTNVLVGDVWLISGQSNADWPLRAARGGKDAIAAATNDLIRYLQLDESPRTDPRAWTEQEVARLTPERYFLGSWQISSPETAGSVSAIGYFFARHIQTNQQVPVGLIDCAVGGTPAESWMPDECFESSPGLKEIKENFLGSKRVAPFARNRLLQNLAAWDQRGRVAPMPEHPYKPGACWRLGLRAIAPFRVRGILWYQGETNADFYDASVFDSMAAWHTESFTALIAGWRRAWSDPDLPVFFVQLPQMDRPSWPWFRESQRQCSMQIPHAWMAIAFDVGDPRNVHPIDKQPVADRLALIARAKSYRQNLQWSGPVCRQAQAIQDKVILHFDHAEGRLQSSPGQSLPWFELAAQDGVYLPAEAAIEGDKVILSTSRVANPKTVRYAWIPSGELTLRNEAGLPAGPFQMEVR